MINGIDTICDVGDDDDDDGDDDDDDHHHHDHHDGDCGVDLDGMDSSIQ